MDPIYSTQAALANAALLRFVPAEAQKVTAAEVAAPVEIVETAEIAETPAATVVEEVAEAAVAVCAVAEAPQVEMTAEEPVVTTKTKKSTKKSTAKAKSSSTEA